MGSLCGALWLTKAHQPPMNLCLEPSPDIIPLSDIAPHHGVDKRGELWLDQSKVSD